METNHGVWIPYSCGKRFLCKKRIWGSWSIHYFFIKLKLIYRTQILTLSFRRQNVHTNQTCAYKWTVIHYRIQLNYVVDVSFKRKNKKGFWFTSEKTTNLGARFHYQQLFWKLWQLQLWWWHRWWYTWWETMILIDTTKKLYILLMVSDCFVHF